MKVPAYNALMVTDKYLDGALDALVVPMHSMGMLIVLIVAQEMISIEMEIY